MGKAKTKKGGKGKFIFGALLGTAVGLIAGNKLKNTKKATAAKAKATVSKTTKTAPKTTKKATAKTIKK